jgi:hypothetical protein
MNNMSRDEIMSKVPEVTLFFWIIKIAATTLGETGGDSVTMTLGWGYLAGTALFFVLLVVLVLAQILAKKFHSFLYWATIVASTTFGTTLGNWAADTGGYRPERRLCVQPAAGFGDHCRIYDHLPAGVAATRGATSQPLRRPVLGKLIGANHDAAVLASGAALPRA